MIHTTTNLGIPLQDLWIKLINCVHVTINNVQKQVTFSRLTHSTASFMLRHLHPPFLGNALRSKCCHPIHSSSDPPPPYSSTISSVHLHRGTVSPALSNHQRSEAAQDELSTLRT